jgi:hypothetical protein
MGLILTIAFCRAAKKFRSGIVNISFSDVTLHTQTLNAVMPYRESEKCNTASPRALAGGIYSVATKAQNITVQFQRAHP